MNCTRLLGAAVVAIVAGTSQAATVVQLDVNSVTATTNAPGFGAAYTGNLTLSADANSGLFGMMLDGQGLGIGFGGPYVGGNFGFSAVFSFVAGNITGVGFTVSASSGLNGLLDNVYAASVSGVGNIQADPGKPGSFFVTAMTHGGSFNGPTYGGVDVSDFDGAALFGNFLNFKIDGGLVNNGSKTDPDVDIDIFVRNSVIPLPTPVGLASVGLLSLVAVRRRRA